MAIDTNPAAEQVQQLLDDLAEWSRDAGFVLKQDPTFDGYGDQYFLTADPSTTPDDVFKLIHHPPLVEDGRPTVLMWYLSTGEDNIMTVEDGQWSIDGPPLYPKRPYADNEHEQRELNHEVWIDTLSWMRALRSDSPQPKEIIPFIDSAVAHGLGSSQDDVEGLLKSIEAWLSKAGFSHRREPGRSANLGPSSGPDRLVITPDESAVPVTLYQIEAFPPLREGGRWTVDLDHLANPVSTAILPTENGWMLYRPASDGFPGDSEPVELNSETLLAELTRLASESEIEAE